MVNQTLLFSLWIFSRFGLFRIVLGAALGLSLLYSPLEAAKLGLIRGVVFQDVSQNRIFSPGDRPIQGVAVSNGREVVLTDRNGRYQIQGREDAFVFVVKPRGWSTPVDDMMIPRFYHRMEGNSGSRSLDFPLYPQEEGDDFEALIFGDTQPRNLEEVYYLAHDTVAALTGSQVAFGVTLGDIVFNNYDIFEDVNGALATIGVPWRHVIGNHDVELQADTETGVERLYNETYGPAYYSFTYGPAHFIVTNNVQRMEGKKKGDSTYRTGLGEDQLAFVRNELERVPKDQPVFLLAHIPWIKSTPWADKAEQREFLKLLNEYPNAASLVSHRHMHSHEFVKNGEGGPPHHIVVMGASCGSWWRGEQDVYGIPHSLMRCGTPTGHGILSVKGKEWKIRYQVARRPADFQMHLHAPNSVETNKSGEEAVFANIFNALPDAEVLVRVGEGEWLPMKRVNEVDPVYAAAFKREAAHKETGFRKMSALLSSPHLWKASLPKNLESGFHVIDVRAKDKWAIYQGRRLIRVE